MTGRNLVGSVIPSLLILLAPVYASAASGGRGAGGVSRGEDGRVACRYPSAIFSCAGQGGAARQRILALRYGQCFLRGGT